MKVSELRASYPEYVIAKNKIELSDKALIDRILDEVKTVYAAEDINTIDGVKISFEARKEWVHLRRSNTEPIIRIYAEAATQEAADALAQQIIDIANSIIKFTPIKPTNKNKTKLDISGGTLSFASFAFVTASITSSLMINEPIVNIPVFASGAEILATTEATSLLLLYSYLDSHL